MSAVADPRSVVEQLLATLNAHDTAAGRALYADDARLVAASGRALDLDGLDAMLKVTLSAFPDLRVRVDRWLVEGDTVVTEEVMEGTHSGGFSGVPATGRPVALPLLHVTTVRDGRIVERVAYYDTAGFIRQIT